MSASTGKSALWRGVRDGAPFLFVVGPFGLMFGVVGREAGLQLAEVMGFSVLVVAGASQFAAVQLMSDGAPLALIVAGALAVNLRMAMYSASLTPWLGQAPFWLRGVIAYFIVDQSYALSAAEYERRPEMSLGERLRYFFGAMLAVTPAWYLGSWIGAVAGARIPEGFPLDFAVPITFIAILTPMLRTPAHRVAALVSVIVALALRGMPSGTGLLIAGLTAMMAGAQVEQWMGRRR